MVPAADDSARESGDISTLLVDGQRILLRADTDVRTLIAELLRAALSKGAFVHVDSREGRSYDLLVTRRTRLLIAHESISLDIAGTDAAWESGIDLEYGR